MSMKLRSFALLLATATATLALACGTGGEAEDGEGDDSSEGETTADTALTQEQQANARAVCNRITPSRWSDADAAALRREFVDRFARDMRENNRLIAERGVGKYVGIRTELGKALARGDKARAATLLSGTRETSNGRVPILKGGANATAVANEMRTTSCIGWILRDLSESYRAIGRAEEWKKINDCAGAWDVAGTRVQQALIKSGWPGPTLGLYTDERPVGWSPEETAQHRSMVQATRSGSYYETPVSTSKVLKNFLPTPGSSTPKDESMLLEIGRSTFFAVGTLRAGYHAPSMVSAALVPDDLIRGRRDWVAAKERGEIFILESHSLRQAWDPTNFEVRPLTEVTGETYTQNVVYGAGTMLFAPGSASPRD